MIWGILLSLVLSVAVSLILWYTLFKPALTNNQSPHGHIHEGTMMLGRNGSIDVNISSDESSKADVKGEALFIAFEQADGTMVQLVSTDAQAGYKISMFSGKNDHRLMSTTSFVFEPSYSHVVVAWDNFAFQRHGNNYKVYSSGDVLKDNEHVANLTDVEPMVGAKYPLRTIQVVSGDDSAQSTLSLKFRWDDRIGFSDVELPQAEVDIIYNTSISK
jgi:hypothetical protein